MVLIIAIAQILFSVNLELVGFHRMSPSFPEPQSIRRKERRGRGAGVQRSKGAEERGRLTLSRGELGDGLQDGEDGAEQGDGADQPAGLHQHPL